jgi:NADP-dependent 3-hydroxy acid dehydrogenase YdfG
MTALHNRVAIVTGSSSGIGAAVATGFPELGAKVVVNSVSSVADGEQLAAKLPDAKYVQADVSDPAGAARLVEVWSVVSHVNTTTRRATRCISRSPAIGPASDARWPNDVGFELSGLSTRP